MTHSWKNFPRVFLLAILLPVAVSHAEVTNTPVRPAPVVYAIGATNSSDAIEAAVARGEITSEEGTLWSSLTRYEEGQTLFQDFRKSLGISAKTAHVMLLLGFLMLLTGCIWGGVRIVRDWQSGLTIHAAAQRYQNWMEVQRAYTHAGMMPPGETTALVSSFFVPAQFERTRHDPGALRRALLADGTGTGIAEIVNGEDVLARDALRWLNEVLESADLDRLRRAKGMALTPEMRMLRRKMQDSDDATAAAAFRRFNRLVLQAVYPRLCPEETEADVTAERQRIRYTIGMNEKGQLMTRAQKVPQAEAAAPRPLFAPRSRHEPQTIFFWSLAGVLLVLLAWLLIAFGLPIREWLKNL